MIDISAVLGFGCGAGAVVLSWRMYEHEPEPVKEEIADTYLSQHLRVPDRLVTISSQKLPRAV